MATKGSGKLFVNEKCANDNDGNRQFTNLNLNQNYKCHDSIPVQSYNKSNFNNKFVSCYRTYLLCEKYKNYCSRSFIREKAFCKIAVSPLKDKTNFIEKNSESRNEESKNGSLFLQPWSNRNLFGKEKQNIIRKSWKNEISSNFINNDSTLSLHITAYENLIESSNQKNDSSKKVKETKTLLLSPKLKDPFEYPRQMDDNNGTGSKGTPEIMQFKASQKLLALNQKVKSKTMKENTTDLQKLFFSKDVKAIEKRLIEMEKYHELEKMSETLLMICKKVKADFELNVCMIPFIRKYFSSLPSTRAKSIADELIAVFDKDHSMKAASSLLRNLSETVQLGNAQRFRELVKTTFVQLYNTHFAESGASEAADDLIITIFEVLMFELNLQDNIDPEKLKEIWLNINQPEDSPVYYLSTFIFYSALGLSEEAYEAEMKLCKFESLNIQKFIEFCEPHLHIPLVLFNVTGARIFLDHLLEHYLLNDKIPHFCKLLFNVPELRNSFLPLIEGTFFPSLILKIWQYCLQKSKKSDKLPQLEALIELMYSYRLDTLDLETNAELFQQIFAKCTSTFSGFTFTKKMKAACMSYALIAMADAIPSFTLNTKLLLIGLLPFALSISSAEEKVAQLQEIYADILKDIPSYYIDKIFDDHECMNNFLCVLIKSSAKESIELRQSGAKIAAYFLHSDWTFISAFLKYLNGKLTGDIGAYKNLLPVFSSAVKCKNGIARSDTVICFQAWMNVYQMEADNLKSKQFRPKKGLLKLYEMLSSLFQMPNFLPENQSKQEPSSVSFIFDLLLIFIQTNRLCYLAEIEIVQEQKLIKNLLDYFLLTDNFGGMPATENSNLMTRFVDTVLLNGYTCGFKDYFVDIQRFMKVVEISNCDEIIVSSIVKSLDEKGVKALKEQIMQKYTVASLSSNREKRNTIFMVFFAMLQTRFSSTFNGMEDYIFELFADNDCLSSDAMKFITAYMDVIRGSKHFADFVSLSFFTASNILASQKFFHVPTAVLAEIKRSLSIANFVKYIIELPEKITILVDQFPVIGRIISKLITNLMNFRHLINEISGKEKYLQGDPIFVELLAYYDHYQKQLSNLTKQLIALKNSIITRQLPFIISNCLSGEREGNLPTYNLLSGCDEASISLMSTALPLIEKRRFGVMFPNFVESNRFTG